MRALLLPLGFLTACGTEPVPSAEGDADGPGSNGTVERVETLGALTPLALRGRWEEPRAIAYWIEAGAPPGAEAFEEAVEAALASWSASGLVGFERAASASTADVLFGWREDVHDLCQPFGRDGAWAHAGPSRSPSFVHFDSRREWSREPLLSAAAHEVGHVLGLDHSADASALMHSPYDPARRELGAVDRAHLRALYGDASAAGACEPHDLVLERTDSGQRVCLAGMLPPGAAASFFDFEEDGRDELLVWRTDAAGAGLLCVLRLAEGEGAPHPTRSFGPYFGVIVPGATVSLARSEDGLLVISALEGGETTAFLFYAPDEGGDRRRPEVPPELWERPRRRGRVGTVPLALGGRVRGSVPGDL